MPLDAYTRQRENGGKTRRRIFRMLASGMSPKEAACALGLSLKTVEYHWHYIKKMLGVKIASQLPWIAWKRRWATATGKWIKAFMCLSMVTSALAVDQPPVLPKIYKSATGIGQGAGAFKLITPSVIIPTTQTFSLSWDYWKAGVDWNTTNGPIRIVLDWSTNHVNWSNFAKLMPDVTNTTATIPRTQLGFFRIGYTTTP